MANVKAHLKDLMTDISGLRFIPCHRIPSRCPKIFGRTFPLCYRCLFILVGYLIVPVLVLEHIHLPMWFGLMLNIPMLTDGVTQAKKWRFSNNTLRTITGLLSGVGQSIVIVDVMNWLTSLLLAM